MKKIAILGSTGSIGTQSLDMIERNPDKFQATVLTCGKRVDLLSQQIEKFKPSLAVVAEEKDAIKLRKKFPHTEILFGMDGLITAASKSDCDMVINALMGMMGLEPTYYAIMAGKDIALANKETLVAGGKIIMNAVKENNVKLIPVDSEHSAIFQALQGNDYKDIKKILLTASGGPFRGFHLEQLEQVTLEQALKHPKWSMGNKITIDSASMMNKGLEVIEARWLFDVPETMIQVLIHPQSIIHSMVEYVDRSIIAQLGVPDMRVPISYALSYPERQTNKLNSVDFFEIQKLTFEKPDLQTFQCLSFAYECLKRGGSYSVALNAANEVLVQLFLEKRIKFIDIQNTIDMVLQEHNSTDNIDLQEIIELDYKIRKRTKEIILNREKGR